MATKDDPKPLLPPRDSRANADVQDQLREQLAAIAALAKDASSAGDRYGQKLAPLMLDAQNAGERLVRALWKLADAQDRELRNNRSALDSAIRASAATVPRIGPAGSRGEYESTLAAQRSAILRQAEIDAAQRAVAELTVAEVGGLKDDGSGAPAREEDGRIAEEPGLARACAAAGSTLEAATGRARITWLGSVGRPTTIEDMAEDARRKAHLGTMATDDLMDFAEAALPDADDAEWARLDTVLRQVVAETMRTSAAAVAARRGPGQGNGRVAPATACAVITRLLEVEAERRMPRAIVAASEALTIFKGFCRTTFAPNASLMTPEEYRAARPAGGPDASQWGSAWQVDANWPRRFLRPRPFVLPGWTPIVGRDPTGSPLRAPR